MSDMSNPPALDGFLRLPAVKEQTGLGSSTIYRRVAKGTFPPPQDLGGGRVGWRRSQLAAWLDNPSGYRAS